MKSLYVVFNYFDPTNLDNFYFHKACISKKEAIAEVQEQAKWRVLNHEGLSNVLVCYLIDPSNYDLTVDDFIDAAEDKYSSGQDLHWDHQEVVYALSNITSDKTLQPIYSLDIPSIEADFYASFMESKGLYVDEDDFYDLLDDAEFNNFVDDKVTTDVVKAFS